MTSRRAEFDQQPEVRPPRGYETKNTHSIDTSSFKRTRGVQRLVLASTLGGGVPERCRHRPRGERLLRAREWLCIGAVAALQSIFVFGVFLAGLGLAGGGPGRLEADRLQEIRNRVFSLLVFTEVLWAFAAKDAARPSWRGSTKSNRRLLILVSVSVVLPSSVVCRSLVNCLEEEFPRFQVLGWSSSCPPLRCCSPKRSSECWPGTRHGRRRGLAS